MRSVTHCVRHCPTPTPKWNHRCPLTVTPRPATVYDVAAAAGLSVATVSRFLAGSGYVGQASRTKIADAIAVLGYVPNRAAASLKSRRSGLLGFVVSDLQNPFVAELAASIGAQARSHGYGMVLSDSQGNPEHSVEAVELLRGHGVDGMIVTPPESPALNDLLLSMYALRIPLVGIGIHTSPRRIDVATVDTRAGATAAVRHLIELGHRRIAMIGSRTLALGRRDAYKLALRTAKLVAPRELLRYGSLDRAGGVRGARPCSRSTTRRPRSSPRTMRSRWASAGGRTPRRPGPRRAVPDRFRRRRSRRPRHTATHHGRTAEDRAGAPRGRAPGGPRRIDRGGGPCRGHAGL